MSDTQTLIENRPPSVAALFLERVAATPDAEAYRYPVPPASGEGPDDWKSLSWAQAAERVYAIAAGLIELGVQPEQRVALASATRVEWILADLGIMCAGAATTTVYPQTNAEEIGVHPLRLRQPGADRRGRRAARQGAREAGRAARARPMSSSSTRRRGAAEGDPEGWVLSLAELEQRGAAYLEKHPDAVKERVGAITADQLATLIYTSGTTGRPKGVRLPHDNWSYMAKAIAATGLISSEDVQYLWLPLAHVFGKVLTSGQIEVGHVTAVDGRVDKIIENLPVVQPTYMAAVPRIFEKVYNGVAAKARAGGGAKYKIFQWAAGVAREYAKVTPGQLPPHRHRLGALRPRRQAQGRRRARLRQAPRGLRRQAARLRLRLRRPRARHRLLLRRRRHPHPGGLRPHRVHAPPPSSTPARPTAPARSASRCPAPRCASRTTARSCCAAPASCRATTGCPRRPPRSWSPTAGSTPATSASCPPDGYLRITDRKKDLIKTSGGKYIAPAEVEGQFKAVCPFVSNILVHGADRNFCTALIALDEPSILGWAKEHGHGGQVVRGGRRRARDGRAHRRLRRARSTRASSAGRPSRSSGSCRATWTSSTAN